MKDVGIVLGGGWLCRFRRLRWGLVVAVMSAVLVASCGSGGDDDPRIGIVSLSSAHDATIDGFVADLAARGWVDGDNIEFVYDGPIGSLDGVDAAVTAMLDEDVDLVFALTTPVALALRNATEGSDLPVVFAVVTDPVGSGIATDLGSPGANITGVANPFRVADILDFLVALKPGTARVLIPHNPDDSASVASLEAVTEVLDNTPLEAEVAEVTSEAELAALMGDVPPAADAILMLQSGFMVSNIEVLVQGALDAGLPLVAGAPVAAQGALFSFGNNFEGVGVQAGGVADSILAGSLPGEIPIVEADALLQLNVATADSIGVVIPAEILERADVVHR